MVYTELAPRRQQFHVAPAMQQPNSAVNYAISVDIKNTRYERIQSLIQNRMRHERSESAREQRTAIYKSDEEEEPMRLCAERGGSSFAGHRPCNDHIIYSASVDIPRTRYVKLQTPIQLHAEL